MVFIIVRVQIQHDSSKSVSHLVSLEVCFHLIKLLLPASVEVGKGISSPYEHVDNFQFLFNKQSRSSKSNETASSLHQNEIEKLHINSENQKKEEDDDPTSLKKP